MVKCLVVAANASRARVFESSGVGKLLVEREDLAHPESRLHARDLTSDLPGRAFDSRGEGRHAMEPATDPKRVEAESFARDIAARVDAARTQDDFVELVLVAPPRFLGLLRDSLSHPSRQMVICEVAKDLVSKTRERIGKTIAEA